MLRYTLHRLLLMIPTVLGVVVLIYVMLQILPGDVVEVKLRGDGGTVSQEVIQAERQRLGLDRHWAVQFADYMVGLARFDLGKSMRTERSVWEEISIRLELSLQLAIMATIFAVLLAIPLGTTAALMRGTWVDYVVRIFTIGGLSIPSFWFGMLIMMVLLHFWNWLPPITFTPIYVDPVANLTQLIWPAMAVGYRYCAVVARMIRSSLLEVLNEGRHFAACAAQRAAARHHRDRDRVRLPDRRARGHRAGIQPERHRQAARAERGQQRLHDHPGHRHPDRSDLRRRQSRGRSPLRGVRSAHPVRVTA